MQEHIQNLESPQTIEYLIHRLQTKLQDLGHGFQQNQPAKLDDLKLLPSGGGHFAPRGSKSLFSPSPPTPSPTSSLQAAASDSVSGVISQAASTNITKAASHAHGDVIGHGHENDVVTENHDGLLLHSDTIILVTSMVVMILLGLVLYQVMAYLTKINNRRTMYQDGLRQIGEQMHVVTRTMSTEPTGASANVTPKTPRRQHHHHQQQKRPLADSPSTARVLREARRGTIFKPPTNIIIRDEELDGAMCNMQTASQQAHFRKLEQIHQREYQANINNNNNRS